VRAAQTGATLAELMGRLVRSTSQAALRYQHIAQDRDAVIAARLPEMVEAHRRRDDDSGSELVAHSGTHADPMGALVGTGCCWTMWVEQVHPGGTHDQRGSDLRDAQERRPERGALSELPVTLAVLKRATQRIRVFYSFSSRLG
jgi:hypothetical protein